jgi:hypothetical protein
MKNIKTYNTFESSLSKKFLDTYKIFEKTSLLKIGVPFSVMKVIQKEYAISSNAEWKKLKYKKEISLLLDKDGLIVSICKTNVYIIFSHNGQLYLEIFKLLSADGFGEDEWKKIKRIKATLDEINYILPRGCTYYYLTSGDWSHEFYNVRKINKEDKKFTDITNDFKKGFASNFIGIIKRMYGGKYDIIAKIVVKHLKDVNLNLKEDEIKNILYNNVIKDNSLTIFDEYLLSFEDEYSDKYGEYLTIPSMINIWSRDKIMTAFMYYLHTKKLMEL